MLNCLISLGANPSLRNLAGQNVLYRLLSEDGHLEIVAQLQALDTSFLGILFEKSRFVISTS